MNCVLRREEGAGNERKTGLGVCEMLETGGYLDVVDHK